MSSILTIFAEQSFDCIEKIEEFFKKAPYHFEMKTTENLFMLCMTDESDLNLQVCREATGIIFEKNTNKLVHYSFAKAYEGFKTSDTISSFQEDFLFEGAVKDSDSLVFDHYFEGSLIKLYFHEGKWKCATSKHLSADANRWGSKNSFEKLFIDCVKKTYGCEFEKFTDSLDTGFCYTFLIQHPEHIMATNVAMEICFALNKINLKTCEETLEEQGILTASLKSISEVYKNNKGLTDNYLVYHTDSKGRVKNRIKMLSPSFLKLKEKIGNLPNIGLRYLEQLNNTDDKLFLRSSFPQCASIFDRVDTLFYKAAQTILFVYNKKYVKKDPLATVCFRFSKIIKQLREEEDKTPVNFENIVSKMHTLNPRELGFLINYVY